MTDRRRRHGPREPGGADGVFHAGMNGRDIEQAGDGTDPKHELLWRGQQKVTPSVPGIRPGKKKGCEAAGVDELKCCQVDDDPRSRAVTAERTRNSCGVKHVDRAAQCHDDMAIAFASNQLHVEHGSAFPLQQQGPLSKKGAKR